MNTSPCIVIVIDHLRPDGTQKQLLQLCRHLRGRGVPCLVVSLRGEGLMGPFLRELGVEVVPVGLTSVVSGLVVPRLIFQFLRRRPRAILTLLFYSDIVGLSVGWLCRIPVRVSSQRAPLGQYGRFRLRIAVVCLRLWATAIVVNASWLVREVSEKTGRTVTVIRNIVEVLRGSEIVAKAPAATPERFRVVTVARLEYEKGVDIAIRGLALSKHRARILWEFFGDGSERIRLEALAQDLGITGMVSFRGFAPTCEEILVGADAYVQPSRFEGSPNALLEAAIMGCPLIASDVQGCREIVAHGETGLLFRSEDPASLAEILDIALDDRERMARIGRHAREIVEARHRPDEIFGQWERVLGLPPDTPGE